MIRTKLAIIFLIFIIGFLSNSCVEYLQAVGKKDVKFVPKTERIGDYTYVIPANFEFLTKPSLIYQDDGITRAYVVYRGVGNLGKLIKFLDTNLKKLGWKKRTAITGDVVLISYERNGQLLIIKPETSLNLIYLRMLLAHL